MEDESRKEQQTSHDKAHKKSAHKTDVIIAPDRYENDIFLTNNFCALSAG